MQVAYNLFAIIIYFIKYYIVGIYDFDIWRDAIYAKNYVGLKILTADFWMKENSCCFMSQHKMGAEAGRVVFSSAICFA